MRKLKLACGAAAVALISVQATAGHAQAAGDQAVEDDSRLNEIVVTARLRDESLQDVPISVSALTSGAIQDAGIKGVGDFASLTPNLTIVQSQSAGASFITIRGITQVRNGEPPVAVVLDGVLQVNAAQFTRELFDVESIQVLRGPQGALYGRNATGGAILITTKQPTNDFEGYLQGGFGNGGEYSVQGTVSGPIVKDKLMFRLAASYLNRDGYLENIVLNKKVDFLEDYTLRGQLKWNVDDRLSVDLRGSIVRTTGGGINFHYQPVTYGSDGMPIAFDWSALDANRVDRKFYANNLGANTRDIDEVSLKIDYEADWGFITSVSSWSRMEEDLRGDQFPYSSASSINPGPIFPFFDGGQTQYVDVEGWSEELRIGSSSDQKFRWMIGGYYVRTNRFISNSTSADLEKGIIPIHRSPMFSDPNNPTLAFFADDNRNTAWALFGNLAYDVTDQLEASVALRYDRDQRRQHVSPDNTGGSPGALNAANFDQLQPKFSLTYKPSDKFSVYATYGIGFRSGQFNQNGVGAVAAEAGIPGISDIVGPEKTKTYELGWKAELLDGRLRLNGAAYHTDVEGQQYFVFVGALNAQVLVNIDKVRLVGGEIEALAKLAPGLEAHASFGVTDSKIKAYALTPSDVGNKAPYVPDTTLNLGLQYRTKITDDLGVFGRFDYERRGTQYWDPENSTARSALNLVNARIGIEGPGKRWTLTGSVANLFDKKYNSEWVGGGFDNPALPRTWRVDIRYNF